VLKFDGLEYDKLSDHIGKILVILHTPYDTEIIRDSSEYRRKWADSCISQHDHTYLEKLIHYQRVLRQRNALLKSMEGKLKSSDEKLLDTYDDQLIALSLSIKSIRKVFAEEIIPFFNANINWIVSDQEIPSIHYKTQVDKGFHQVFKSFRKKDIMLQRTNCGIHRDDFLFFLNEQMIKRFGSQGQQKSFLISLRLTQYDYLLEKMGVKPILLLDDVFDKLDDERIKKIVLMLSDEKRFGQVFITDARKERSLRLFQDVSKKQIFEIENGKANVL
jgi:DNA replication and repair protein RecF